ncbi:MAG: S9 family peptidase [Steroidobacter sp.]
MKKGGCVSCVLFFLSSSLQAAPLEAYGRLPQYEKVVLSPDGQRAAFVTTVKDERTVLIQSLNSTTGVIQLKAGPQMLRDLRWAGADQLLIETSQPSNFFAGSQSEMFALQNFDLRRNKAFSPMMWVDNTWNLLASTPEIRMVNEKPIVFQKSFTIPRMMSDHFATAAFYRIDLMGQSTRLIDAQPVADATKSYNWMVDASGNLIVQTVYDETAKRWALSLRRNDQWIEVQSEKDLIETPYLLGLAPEDDTVVVMRKEGGEWVPKRLSLLDGKWGESFPPEWRGSTYITDSKTQHLIGVVDISAHRRYRFFDATLQQQWDQVAQSFQDEEVFLESWSDDHRKLILKVFGKRTGAGYVFVDLISKTKSYAGDLYAGIGANDIALVKPITYKAADGLQIPGYLTLPNGRELVKLPLVVLPHGGPDARDVLEFDWWAQALASRGYIVLQPNYRGSSSVDERLRQAGYGEWGRKMQTDLSDGVRQLVKLGFVDPARVCIVGASYGGYAALAAAAFEPEAYRCAVSVAGVSDVKRLVADTINTGVSDESRATRYLLRYIGADNPDDPRIDEISPALHADKIKIPILLLHGSNDSVVQFEQSQIMADALRKAGKSYELVKLKSEDHWLSKAETRLQMLEETVRFLEKNNPP